MNHSEFSSETIVLAHGSGGLLTHELLREVFLRRFDNAVLAGMDDAAKLPPLPPGQLALTTDSYVVQPLFFPGGDIGKLAICGTVNDLAVTGAKPLYLSCGFIIEEGLPLETLERVVDSMADTARIAGVQIVTGDTKVVEHGAADGIFINTAGVGVIAPGVDLAPARMRPGDAMLVNGPVGDHGVAVMLAREGLNFHADVVSDCAPLNALIASVLETASGSSGGSVGVRCMRDATRGGLATVLCEWAESGLGIEIEERAVPVREAVRAVSEFLGLDPLYSANEGTMVLVVAPELAETALATLRAHPLGQHAAIIGHVTAEHVGRVVLRTPYGARRIVQMLAGAQLPRIC